LLEQNATTTFKVNKIYGHVSWVWKFRPASALICAPLHYGIGPVNAERDPRTAANIDPSIRAEGPDEQQLAQIGSCDSGGKYVIEGICAAKVGMDLKRLQGHQVLSWHPHLRGLRCAVSARRPMPATRRAPAKTWRATHPNAKTGIH